MRYVLALVAVLLASSAVAAPQDAVTLTMGKPSGDGPYEANFAVQNLTDRLLNDIHVKCAALNGQGEPLETSGDTVDNLRPHETGYGSATLSVDWYTDHHYVCRVDHVD